ncbi:hypothetical protein M601_008780 [Cellulophaga baltica 4]|nr:hypothetical protein M601_008780 [Cellulophaga baltica 4]
MATYTDEYADGNLDLNVSLGGDIVSNDYNYIFATTNGGLSIPGFYNLSGSVDAATTSTEIEQSKTRGAFFKNIPWIQKYALFGCFI